MEGVKALIIQKQSVIHASNHFVILKYKPAKTMKPSEEKKIRNIKDNAPANIVSNILIAPS